MHVAAPPEKLREHRHIPRSLAEAQLITNFQLFSYESQQLLASCMSLVVEQYSLQQTRKPRPAFDQQDSEHQRELSVINFGRKLLPKLQAPFRAICQELSATSELEFTQVLQQTGLLRALESQESSLIKTEIVEDINLPALKKLHYQFPVRTEDQLIS